MEGCPAWIIGIVEKDHRTARIIEMPRVIKVLSKETPEDKDTWLNSYQSIKSFFPVVDFRIIDIIEIQISKSKSFPCIFCQKIYATKQRATAWQ